MNARIVFVAAATLIGMGSAQAASFASASAVITNLQVTLIDLNPDDGIAPAISFLSHPTANDGYADAGWNSPNDGQFTFDRFINVDNPWLPGQANAATAYSSAFSALSGGSTFAGSELRSSGMAISPGDYLFNTQIFFPNAPSASFTAFVSAPLLTLGTGFEISPFTLAIFSATVELQAEAIEGGFSITSFGSQSFAGNSGLAIASLTVQGPGPTGASGGSQRSDDERRIDLRSRYSPLTGTWTNQSLSLADTVSVSFTNFSASAMVGNFGAYTSAQGRAHGTVSPIPEPSTWALLLAGIAVVSRAVARRR